MITYKIDGVPATFKSKPINLERDIARILAKAGLSIYTQVTIIQDDILKPDTDSASDSNAGELTTLPEDTATPDGLDESQLPTEAADMQSLPDRLDKLDLSDDESITDFNDYPFSVD